MDLNLILHESSSDDQDSADKLFISDPDLTAGNFPGISQDIELLPGSALPVYQEKYNSPVPRRNANSRSKAPRIYESPTERNPKIETETETDYRVMDVSAFNKEQEHENVRVRPKQIKRKSSPIQSPSFLAAEKKRKKADIVSRRTRSRNQYGTKSPVTIILDSSETESEDNSGHETLLVQGTPETVEDSRVEAELGIKAETVAESCSESESEIDEGSLLSYQIKRKARNEDNSSASLGNHHVQNQKNNLDISAEDKSAKTAQEAAENTQESVITKEGNTIPNNPSNFIENESDPITESESGTISGNKHESNKESKTKTFTEIDSDPIVEHDSENTIESHPQLKVGERSKVAPGNHIIDSQNDMPSVESESISSSERNVNDRFIDENPRSDHQSESDSGFSSYEDADDTDIFELNVADFDSAAKHKDATEKESEKEHEHVNEISIEDNDNQAKINTNEREEVTPESRALVLSDSVQSQIQSTEDSTKTKSDVEELPFICSVPECPHRVRTKALLKKHTEGHLQQKRLNCHYCDWSANRLDFLDMHMKFHDQYKNIRDQFREKVYLNSAPSGRKESDPSLMFKCDECDMAFKRSDHLSSHKLVHSNEKIYPCDNCEETFKRASDLTVHASTCVIRARKCAECSKKFKNERRLIRHLRMEHMQCKKCGIKFNSRRGLSLHMHYRHSKHKENPNDIEKLLTNGNNADKNRDDSDNEEDNEADISVFSKLKNRFLPTTKKVSII